MYLVGLVTVGFGGPALLAGTDLAVETAARIVLVLLSVPPLVGGAVGARMVRRRDGDRRQALCAGAAGPVALIGVLTLADAAMHGVAAAGLAATAAGVLLTVGGAALGAGRT